VSQTLSFDPSTVTSDNKQKYGESLKKLAEEDVTIDNYRNYRQRIETYCGQIGDDITELQKEIQRLDDAMEGLEDRVGEEKLEAYRESNRDLLDLSIGEKDTLAYRKLKKLKKIENKRSYRSAHLRLLAKKFEEILVKIDSIDSVVKRRTESLKAEILNELESTESAVVDTVDNRVDELGREHDQITRLQKSGLKMTQDMSQHLSLGLDSSALDGVSLDSSDEVKSGTVSSEGEPGESATSETSDKYDTTENQGDGPLYELKDRTAQERKDELDRLVSQQDNLADMKKDEIAELTDVSRQALFYSDKGGIVGEIESQFTGVEYPEL